MTKPLIRLISAYRTAAVVLLNIAVLFVAVNLIALVALAARDFLKAHGGSLIPDNPWEIRTKLYPGWKSDDIFDLFIETWERPPFQYEPMAQFKEAPFAGRFVNVSKHGFRKGPGKNTWPP